MPGSTSNLGAGFDCVGMAVDRWLRVTARIGGAAPAPRITREGTLAAVREPAERDAIWRGFVAACNAGGALAPRAIVFAARSTIPVGRGLGSSAAALVAGAALAAAMLGLRLGAQGIAALSARLEGHPDNAVPSTVGGTMLAVMRDARPPVIAPIAPHPSLAFVFAIPDFAVETSAARAALPMLVRHATAVEAARRAAALVHGLVTGDEALLAAGLDDVLHVPHRRALVRGYDAVARAAAGAGAIGATLSGAGSGMVAIAPRARADDVARAMTDAWREADVRAETFVHTRPVRGYHLEEPAASPGNAAAGPCG
ncbi:MAG TPA: homoserine kinase [Gemmatimonadaceae bacterium]|nr:homoserine kinase [Gemmatimonadaceae bacterium]